MKRHSFVGPCKAEANGKAYIVKYREMYIITIMMLHTICFHGEGGVRLLSVLLNLFAVIVTH